MTTNFEHQKLGEISEGILGNLDLYLVDLPSTVDAIYNERVSNGENTGGEDETDEFYFLAPSGDFGTKSKTTTTAGTATFVAPKAGEEPMVLWKAFYQFVGKFYTPASPGDLDIKSEFDPTNKAYFTLPKIPAMMIEQLDRFFRAVDKAYHTEGIVLLTYDFDYKGTENASDGWGFAVPPQKNTSVHCNYDKTEVVESLPENTKIVGTVHSHPGMAAYASQTDHNDQAGFDGLHITFGWLATKGNVTEYHAELVTGHTFFGVNPADVMDLDGNFQYKVVIDGNEYILDANELEIVDRQFEIADEDVESWTKNVEKGVQTGSTYGGSTYGTNQGGGTPKVSTPVTRDTSDFLPENLPNFPSRKLTFGIFNIPDPQKNNIFLRVDEAAGQCPVCMTIWGAWSPAIYDRRQCLGCGSFLLFGNETIEDIDLYRTSQGYWPFADFLETDAPFTTYDPVAKKWTEESVIFVDGQLEMGGGPPKAQSS